MEIPFRLFEFKVLILGIEQYHVYITSVEFHIAIHSSFKTQGPVQVTKL